MKRIFIILGIILFSCIGIFYNSKEIKYDYSLSKSIPLLNKKISEGSFNENFDNISLNGLNIFYQKDTDKAVIINSASDDY